MKSRYLKAVAFLALTAVVGIATSQIASAQSQQNNQGLVGTWLFQISIQDCNSGAPLGQSFMSLLTFAQGGTMTETTANPAFFPAVRSPGHGVWSVDGPHTFEATSTAFITSSGALVRLQTITQTIELLTPDSLQTTSASVKFYSPAGVLLTSGCAAATAQRIQLAQ